MKKLSPPRGAAQTRAAAESLERRFTPPPEPDETPAAETPDPAAKRRTPPPDRVHRTLYLDRDTDAAVMAAIDRVHEACSGMVPRHQIIAALIRRGLDAEAAVVAELKTQLRDRLNLD